MLKYILTAIVIIFGVVYFYGSINLKKCEQGSAQYQKFRYIRMAGCAGIIIDAIVCMIV